MRICYEFDCALREERKRKQKKEDKIRKLQAVINDKGASQGEKDTAEKIINKLSKV